jgi:DNA (cytosine-5)-methyltransferase 1
MLRFVEKFRPKAVMMENVPRLARHSSFKEFCRGLARLGYECKFEIKNASKYAVPQRRRRLILLAGRGFLIPFAQEARTVRTVKTAIGSLELPSRSSDMLHSMPEKLRSAKVKRLINDIPRNGGSRGDLPLSRQLPCHRKIDGFRDIYGRMAWNEVAPTITSGCSNPSKGRFLHPTQNRAITLREAALLQTFPKKYFFPVEAGKEAIALLIGNALPPEFIRRHATVIRQTLLKEFDG